MAGAGQDGQDERGRRRRTWALVGVMMAAPFVALLWVSSYARTEPRLLGFPFFYWYQLAWVFITAALTGVALVLVRRVQITRAPLSDGADRLDRRAPGEHR